jgi:hypothetical protein
MSDHLSTQGRPDPRGGLRCFLCPNKTQNPLIGASNLLKIVKNILELKKVAGPPQSRGGQEPKKKTNH